MSLVIDKAKIQEIRKKLKAMPKLEIAKKFNGQEALEALKEDIQALADKGYDCQAIAKILKQEGIRTSKAKVSDLLTDEKPESQVEGQQDRSLTQIKNPENTEGNNNE